jgi:membrane protease YdiL (CAAX protease family)
LVHRVHEDGVTARSELRGFGPAGLLAIAVIVAGNLAGPLVGALLVILWARLSGTPPRALGFSRPRRWALTIVASILLGVAFKLAMKAVVMPLLGADPINRAYHYLAGNTAALPLMLVNVILVAGLGEEIVYRGYLFERLGKLLGSRAIAKAAIVVIAAAIFGAAHYSVQGLAGVQQATIGGLVFGTAFAVTNRLWPLIIAHAAFDVAAVFIIYWDLEYAIAHWVFR